MKSNILENIFHYVRSQKQYIDKPFWIILGILVGASCIFMFSASTTLVNQYGILRPIVGHMGGLLFGIAVAFVVQFIPSKYIRRLSYIGLLFSLLCLILTFTSLGHEINGEKRWVNLGGFVFQPSELVKICLVIVVSDLLSRITDKDNRRKIFWITLGLIALVCALILPTNLSTALLIGIVMMLLFFLARIPVWWLLCICLVMGSIGVGGYVYVNKQYVEKGIHMTGGLDRAETWVVRINDKIAGKEEPVTRENFKENYQANLANVAVARGGQTPLGVLPGNSWAREKLPQAYSDFIFAIIVEEIGLLGSIALIFVYLAILFRACYASSRYNDYSAMLMMMGLALMLTFQAWISMEVSVGLGPVTGQTLPLISHGKTSSVVFCLYFGIMMAVSREQQEKRAIQNQTMRESEDIVPELDGTND